MAAPMTWKYVKGEMVELWEAIMEGDLAHTWEEWNDVWCLLLIYGLPYTGKLPLLPGFGLSSQKKFEARLEVWKKIFVHHNLVFRKEYLVTGGNYRKKTKIIRVLQAAKAEQSSSENIDWIWLSTFIEFELE